MKIAQVAPLYESVPPIAYGGTERIVSYLTEELTRQGHDVTLFASGDSVTQAKLVSVCKRSLRLDEGCIDQLSHHMVMLEQVMQRADEFDVIHFHASGVGPAPKRIENWCSQTSYSIEIEAHHDPEWEILGRW